MPDPKQVTLQEAFTHIQEWIKSGEKEKAKQGLKEILEFDPTNDQAKKMLAEQLETPKPATVPAIQSSPTPSPAISTPSTPAPASSIPIPMPAPDQSAAKKQKLQKIIAMTISILIFFSGGFFLYKTFFGGDKNQTEEIVATESESAAPAPTENSEKEKVRRR